MVAMKPGQMVAAIALVLSSALLFALMDATVKYVGGLMSIVVVLMARYSVQAVLMAAWVAGTQGRAGFVTHHLGFQVLRGLVLCSLSGMVVLCLRSMPLAEFTSVIMLSPVVITAIAGWKLKESVGRLRWVLLCGGFLGTLLVVRPGAEVFDPSTLLALVAMLGTAAYSLISARLSRLEGPHITQFYTGITVMALVLPLVLLEAEHLPGLIERLSWGTIALLLLMGVLSSIGHLTLLMAFKRAGTASLMPFTYSQIGFAALLGWIVFDHTPDGWAWAGMITIATSGVLSAWLNTSRAARESLAAAGTPVQLEKSPS